MRHRQTDSDRRQSGGKSCDLKPEDRKEPSPGQSVHKMLLLGKVPAPKSLTTDHVKMSGMRVTKRKATDGEPALNKAQG